MRVVACSPFTKLFLPEWEERLLENPDLIMKDDEPFSFSVPRAVGAVENVKYGVPFRVDDYLRGSAAAKDSKAAYDLKYYLTGGDDGFGMQETEWTGIVELDVGSTGTERAMAEIHQMVMTAQMSGDEVKIGKAKAQMDLLMKKSFKDTQEAMVAARGLADQRVIKQLKTTHHNLLQQYKHNKEDGKGLYMPSGPEHFGLYVLNKIVKISKGRLEMNTKFNALLNQVWVN